MKKEYLITAILLSLAVSSYSQNDSIMYLKDIDLSYYSTRTVKYQSTGEVKTERLLNELENVNFLSFMNNDSVALFVNSGAPVYTKLSEINDVSKYKYRVSPAVSILCGAVGGGLIGGFIGYAVSDNSTKPPKPADSLWFENMLWRMLADEGSEKVGGAVLGALIGAVAGGIISAVITSAINYVTLDLFSVPARDKKSKLIKFLNHK